MLVRAGIGERADALMRPLLGRLGDLTSRKGIESIWPILGSIERFEEILHRRVIGGIADKYDLEAAEQRLNVAGCPAIGEIGPAEVGDRQHEFIVAGTSIVGIDPAMDMQDSAKMELAPWGWKPGRLAACQHRISFLEQQVELGGDQTCHSRKNTE